MIRQVRPTGSALVWIERLDFSVGQDGGDPISLGLLLLLDPF